MRLAVLNSVLHFQHPRWLCLRSSKLLWEGSENASGTSEWIKMDKWIITLFSRACDCYADAKHTNPPGSRRRGSSSPLQKQVSIMRHLRVAPLLLC